MDKKTLRRIGIECQELARMLASAQNVPSLPIAPPDRTGSRSLVARLVAFFCGTPPVTERRVQPHPATPAAMQGLFIPDHLTQRQVGRLVNALLNAGNYLEFTTRDGDPPNGPH